MAKCLVTGGAGFIGAHVARALLDDGHEVVVLDDLSGGFRENVDGRARFVEGSICDEALVQQLFASERFERVYHLAAYAAEGLSHFVKRFNYENNLIGSINLINAAVNHNVDCFVFTSSIAVYGRGQVPLTEETKPEPDDSYGIAKYAIEQELKATHDMFGMDFIVFRPHNVFGELQNIGDRYRNVVGIFINQIMQNQPLSVFGDGEQTRAFTYIDGVAPVIARSPEVKAARNQVFNIGADVPYTILELTDAVRRHMGVPDHPLVHHEERHEVKHAWSDHSRIREVFGDATGSDLETGLERMVAWARQVGARKSQAFSEIEIRRNLPASWLED